MRVIHGARSAVSGGAARAAFRIHQAQQYVGLNSSILTGDSLPLDPHSLIVRSRAEFRYSKEWLERRIARLQRTSHTVLRSTSLLPGRAMNVLLESESDVINLHWINGGFLSIKQIGNLMKERKVVWTLHDMWPLCGLEHYGDLGGSRRWLTGYGTRSREERVPFVDVDRHVWKRKARAWTHPTHIVAPSQWLATCVQDSKLMAEWPVTVIPNPIDLDVFRPHEQSMARRLLGLPQDVPLVLFGAIGGSSDSRKGWDLLSAALTSVIADMPEVELVVLGQKVPPVVPGAKIPIHALGHLQDDLSLALAYSASTCAVVPSRQENLPQAATEPTACGTPVVAFEIGGLPDIVVHRKTGYLAKAFDPDDLASGIAWVVDAEHSTGVLGLNARLKAVNEWSYEKVGNLYAAEYRRVLLP